MSYLLTEIALEMLGYKFYDTNGVFHLTNFQNNSTQFESHPDEPSLTEFIEQTECPDEDLDSAASSKEENLTTEPSRATTSNLPNPTVSDAAHPTQRRAPAKALAKIMDYESDKIASQITARLEKAIARLGAADNEAMLEECINEEKRLICEDADEMQKFREFLQGRLQQIDKRPFEKYVRTFGSD